ncbi:neuronal acetylcholine receptor subunit alpha-10-like [Mercenaria mercenaria]|uniref:neuronal acetylcholine receptor subunit alpha-10-like n=1 Tax=Mercenaria mercenaria TaxID=6596 RepID=UPI001E1D638E|nr:neuronal acetylcholine receptor subunit alpha-10-like [Mercenaria mercenaria]
MWSIYICVGVLLIVLLRQSAGLETSKTGTLKDRTLLYKALAADYQKDLIPDGPNGGPIVVSHHLFIRRVAALENGVLTLETYEDMRWTDPRLKWDPKKYNINMFNLPSRLIWQPDVMLVNSADRYTGHTFGDMLAIVKSDGNVLTIPPKVTKAFCQFDESSVFEKNEVICTLTYMSWTHHLRDLDIRVDREPEVLLNTNPYWKVTKISTARKVHKYSFDPDEKFVDIHYVIRLKRLK